MFPRVLLIIFGSIPSFHKPAKELGGISYLDAYVPILIALVLALLAISALPVVLASYREKGILRDWRPPRSAPRGCSARNWPCKRRSPPSP